jgi:DNA-binding response OmpR family regulator
MVAMSEGSTTVLHVEDDADLAGSVSLLLRAGGYRAITAHSADDALDLIGPQRLRPDILIIDFNLAGSMDGAELAEEACRIMGHCIPTILLSGQLANSEMPWMPGVPVLPLSKPADPEVLLKAVETFSEFERFAATRRRARVPGTPLVAAPPAAI